MVTLGNVWNITQGNQTFLTHRVTKIIIAAGDCELANSLQASCCFRFRRYSAARALDNTRVAHYNMIMKDKELLSLLRKNGWQIDRINGSHHILIKDGETISLHVHGKDMKKGLEAAI